jgi:glycosyltransferase involved in cell wall biosynthesis
VISSLRRAGVEVDERHVSVWDGRRDAWRAGIGTAFRLARAELGLLRRRRERYDAVIVGYPGQVDIPAARRAARGAPVVFNPLVALSDTLVDDRGRFAPGSLPARTLRLIDRAALRAADVVVADTDANARFLEQLAGLEHVETCFVGAEDEVFSPTWRPAAFTHALFVGKLIPLHGIETILTAATLAPELAFRIVGSGQLEALLERRSDNVEWVPWVEYGKLRNEHAAAGVALGIFGTSSKAARVIPNKAFQALACGAPLVTADTPAARELLTDGQDSLLVPPGDPGALAQALRRLASDDEFRTRIGFAGITTYHMRASEAVLGWRWREIIERAAA